MPSAWIEKRAGSGQTRFRVRYRLGGRETPPKYAGMFGTKREAVARRAWLLGELAAMRAPDTASLTAGPKGKALAEAINEWRDSRVDVTEATRGLHRIALNRVLPVLGTTLVDEIEAADVARLVESLAAAGKKRETIRKSVKYLAAVLDYHGVHPNPARDRQRIRLPHEEPEEINPPTAAHVEAVYRTLAKPYRLPLLWLDWSGARVASVDLLRVGDYDQPQRRIRLRASTTKTRQALWVELPDVLAEAIEATLPPREDLDLDAQLFPDAGSDRLRTAIARACKATGVPVFSPHDLRHRRISLLHRQGRSWAEIGRFVGQRKLSVTADTYTHVLVDENEIPLAALLEQLEAPGALVAASIDPNQLDFCT
jgi:integrase